MALCNIQTYNGPKDWFSATVGQEPDVEVGRKEVQEGSAAIVSH